MEQHTSHPTHAELVKAYKNKKVLVTGHTGFKGSWLTLWLEMLGAKVTGLALKPDTKSALFEVAQVGNKCSHNIGDIRERDNIKKVLATCKPDVVIHLAAQPIVLRSYNEPLLTLETNLMGTAHLLEELRLAGRPCAVVIVTTDKCYENHEWPHGYREEDQMGGHDVYSMSKGAVELLVSSYRRSFLKDLNIHVATARAGNVIGGGDWAENRLVPDAMRALGEGKKITVRSPNAVRPWQHALEPLSGYLLLGARLLGLGPNGEQVNPQEYAEAWNFGPELSGAKSVSKLIEAVINTWGKGDWEDHSNPNDPHEATYLRLCVDKANMLLGWTPRWNFDETIKQTIIWYKAYYEGNTDLGDLCRKQIMSYMETK